MRAKPLIDSPPHILRDKFLSLDTIEDLASLLEVDVEKLDLYSYKIQPGRRYTKFLLPKRSQGYRTILAPIKGLKFIQRKLAQVLQSVYSFDDSVHGYVLNRSIVSNAECHARQKYILNVDIKDFFPSINFGRVRGLFIHRYGIKPAVATVIAQICCFENQLPQGAPTSPIVSNMICVGMDKQFARFAERHGCQYTRYADDLTFSTSEYRFPYQLARKVSQSDSLVQVRLGEDLLDIIENNGFRVNRTKVRLQEVSERQVVTGLVVNRFPNVRREYIRQIRAMLHAWDKYRLDKAQNEYREKYSVRQHRAPYKSEKITFKDVVRGKITFLGMVRGREDTLYIRFWNQLVALDPTMGKPISKGTELQALIYTEGKTDPQHLRAALRYLNGRGRFLDLEVDFIEDDLGHDSLLKMCESLAKTPNDSARIFIFDRDIGNAKKKVAGEDGFRSWGNNVFSLLLPIPSHRTEDADSVCIELFYEDDDLRLHDRSGRRLFLSREFNKISGRHESLDLICSDRNKYSKSQLLIVDSQIYDHKSENVALSKSDFANHIIKQVPPFDNINFSEFEAIFVLIKTIIDLS